MAAAGLEARYRRLLRWYPAGHRAVHGEEMLGVLMAASEPGRDRPGLSGSADLLAGAARIRLRPGNALSDGNGWRDALAVYSLAGPVLVLAATFLSWLAAEVWSTLDDLGGVMVTLGPVPNGAFDNVDSTHPVIGTLLWLLLAGQGIVAVLSLAGLRRSAAVAAALYVLYFGTYVVVNAPHWPFPRALGQEMPLLLVAPLTTLVALLASAGPRRGRQLMQRRHWASLAAGSLAAAALVGRVNIVGPFVQPVRPWLLHLFDAAAMAAVVLALVVAWLSSPLGKRLAMLFGVLAFSASLELVETYFSGPGGLVAANVLVPACEAIVLCVLAAIVYRTWRRAKSAGNRGPAGPGPGTTAR
jgi:hypothetical protein